MIDRTSENRIFYELSELQFSPKMYGTFANGRVEQVTSPNRCCIPSPASRLLTFAAFRAHLASCSFRIRLPRSRDNVQRTATSQHFASTTVADVGGRRGLCTLRRQPQSATTRYYCEALWGGNGYHLRIVRGAVARESPASRADGDAPMRRAYQPQARLCRRTPMLPNHATTDNRHRQARKPPQADVVGVRRASTRARYSPLHRCDGALLRCLQSGFVAACCTAWHHVVLRCHMPYCVATCALQLVAAKLAAMHQLSPLIRSMVAETTASVYRNIDGWCSLASQVLSAAPLPSALRTADVQLNARSRSCGRDNSVACELIRE